MMNLFRKIFGDRRKRIAGVKNERRHKNVWRRWKDAGDDLDNAVDALDQTVRMNTAQFAAIMHKSREQELTLVENGAAKTVEFITFAEICRFHYSPKDSLMSLCKNPKHEAAQSGIAPCQRAVCPFYTERK